MPTRCSLLLLLLSTTCLVCHVAHGLNVISASDARVKWVGRRAVAPQGEVQFDWEGVSASVGVQSGFTMLAVNITDNCQGTNVGGGSRWLVTMTTSNGNTAAPAHRISTFFTAALQQIYVLFSNPSNRCDPACDFSGTTTFTLTRLSESRLSGCSSSPNGGLSVNAFITDGAFAPTAPADAKRRIEFVGDSISAGDLNDNGGVRVCGNAVFNDDITLSSGGQLCLPEALGGFGADCMFTAWGGIQLGVAPNWGMSQLYPHTFSGSGLDAYGSWNFTSFLVDAIVINLGTNDNPKAPATQWIQAYQDYVTQVVQKYYANPNLVVFICYGPMTAEYQPFVTTIVANLQQTGIKAHLLDLTLPHPMTGCYNHPSAADNVEIAAKAKPQIAAVMGW